MSRLRKPRFAAEPIDGFIAGGLDDPGARQFGDAAHVPLLDGGSKGLLRRLFGELEVANHADQGGDDPAPVGAVDLIDRGAGVGGHARW
jgi:hypothetical protein